MDGRAMVEGMGSVGVAEPVGTNRIGDTNSLCGPTQNHADAATVQRPSTPGAKNQFLGPRRATAVTEFHPQTMGQGNGPRPSILAENRYLTSSSPEMKIPPPQAAGFGYPQAGGVKQAEQEPVSWFGFGGEHSLHLLLAKDSFRQAILVAWQRQFRRRIDWQVPHPVAEGEQALNGGQRARPGDGS